MVLMAGSKRYRIAFGLTVITGIAYLMLRCWSVWGMWLEFSFSVIFELPLIIWIILGGAEKLSVVVEEDALSLCELFDPVDFPEVVIYIPTYDEPAHVLQPVIDAALQMDYPINKLKVLVLDDGGREFVRCYVEQVALEMAEANLVPLQYIARTKPEVHWAKAGNINNAFIDMQLQGEFVLILDADMVASPQMLQRMLPAFYDNGASNRVAWCQSPQTFSNIKWGDPLDHAQTMWYKVGIVGRDAFAAVPFCGTNAILRSAALRELKGLKYGALTEDLHSSMCLAAKGWRGRYVAEPLAVGLAPPNLYESFVQRIRWARGSWDMLTLDNIITSRHLTFRQKAAWFMLGYMPLVAVCILVTIIFRFIRPNASGINKYSWIALTLHFILARYTSLFSPGAGVVAPLYLMWRDSTAFFTYFSIHIFTLVTAVTCTTAKFVTTGKDSDDPEAGRWHSLCWWNVFLSVGSGLMLVWLTDGSVCDSMTTFGAFVITFYIFISNWDVMSVILNPITRWPLDPHANNTTIITAGSSGDRGGEMMKAFASQETLAMSTASSAADLAQSVTVTAIPPPSPVLQAPALPTVCEGVGGGRGRAAAVGPLRHKTFLRWFSGLRGVCILVLVLFHIQLGVSNSGLWGGINAWGDYMDLPHWLSSLLWPLGAAYGAGDIALKLLVMSGGFSLSMSCSRRDINFKRWAEYTQFVKTRLQRLLALCYINILAYLLQDMISGAFDFTSRDHWVDLALTVTFTNQFSTKFFFPRVNGVLWYMGQAIVSCIVCFPVLLMAMRKFGCTMTYVVATFLSATVRYFGMLKMPSGQMSPNHHIISVSFIGYLGVFSAGMVAYSTMASINHRYATLPKYAQSGLYLVKWALFAAACTYITSHVYRADNMTRSQWYLNLDRRTWKMFTLQASFFDMLLELAFIALFLSLGLHSSRKVLPEAVLSCYPLVLPGAMTFSIFVWHFRPCATLLWGVFSLGNCISFLLFSLLPVALVSYRCIEKYEVVGFWKPFLFSS